MKTKKCSGQNGCGETKPLSDFNKNKRDKTDYCALCKICKREYAKTMYQKNKADILKKNKIYREKNKEIISIKRKKYREENKEKLLEREKQYREDNREDIRESDREYYIKNKDVLLARKKQYIKDHREEIATQKKDYYAQNKTDIIRKVSKYHKTRLLIDAEYKIACNLRRRLNHAIKGKIKTGSSISDLGCSVSILKKYIEELFYPCHITNENMTWNNYGLSGWHIDHIIPLAKFDLTDRDQFLKACHYTNLQPLWAKDHYIKTTIDINNLKISREK